MKKIISSVVASAILFGTTVYAKDIYAEVDGQKVTKEDIAMLIRNPNVDFDALPKTTQDEVMSQLVDKVLLSNMAMKSGIDKNPDFEQALQKLKSDLALEVWMQTIAKDILATITDKEASEFYTKNKDKFEQFTRYRAKHILVKSEKEANDIIKELGKSKKVYEDFTRLAKAKTQDPSGKESGGDLGWFEANKMVPEFSAATKNLKVGAFTNAPVKTDYGYHVIYLEDVKNIELAGVKQVLAREKFNIKIKEMTTELRKTAKITIN